jgi:hypothetical protein
MVPGQYEFRRWSLPAGERRYQIITPHMSVNYVYAVLLDQVRDRIGRNEVEGVS